jgi:gamma-glutamylcyclotransferase (GGCT)/AIG2-like uncharacterized protein YtfP
MFNNIFIYGTLRDPEVLSRLLRRVPPMKPAKVEGFRKYFDSEAGFPMAIKEKGSVIEGALMTGIGSRDLSSLDDYEGVRKGLYKRITVQVVPTGAKVPVEAFMYVKETSEL